jgi:hypothetical protein
MRFTGLLRNGIFSMGILSMALSPAGLATVQAQQAGATNRPPALPVQTPRDGQHDFDFEVGHFNIHLSRRLHPLTGSTEWVEFDGTSLTKPLWDGKGNIEQFETDSPNLHVEGLTLRVYNPTTHQWSLYWANSKDPDLGTPITPMVGHFNADGVGEFYDQELWNGRAIYVRFIWSRITANSAHFEQSFSEDGGRTWEVNWITDQTRVPDNAGQTQK